MRSLEEPLAGMREANQQRFAAMWRSGFHRVFHRKSCILSAAAYAFQVPENERLTRVSSVNYIVIALNVATSGARCGKKS